MIYDVADVNGGLRLEGLAESVDSFAAGRSRVDFFSSKLSSLNYKLSDIPEYSHQHLGA